MKKKLKTEVIIALFRMLNEAKYSKMNDDGKIKTWRILRALKPIAVKFDDDMKTAREKLRPEGYDELLNKAQQLTVAHLPEKQIGCEQKQNNDGLHGSEKKLSEQSGCDTKTHHDPEIQTHSGV